jgi:murein DD-endopeptidase MepM/ murein hydrolase activator NlpD
MGVAGRGGRGQGAGVLRILICSVLVVLSVGSPGVTDPVSLRGHAGAAAEQRFGWPLAGSPTVVRPFWPPVFRYGPGHRGVDLAAVAGASVLAAGAGTVVFAGMVAGHGVVSVSHQGGLRTTYEPVSATVAAGQRVARGQQIGTVQPGHASCPVPVCLHWGVVRSPVSGPQPGELEREYLDPLRLLAWARVRLLPIDDAERSRCLARPGVLNPRRLPASCSAAAALHEYGAGTPEIR